MSDFTMNLVGPRNVSAGVATPQRADPTSMAVVTLGHGRFSESARIGRVFTIDSDSVTLAAANTTKSALATAKFINGFYNPLDSGRVAAILRATVAGISGTFTGPFVWNAVFSSVVGVVTSAATGAIRNGLLSGSGVSGSVMVPQVGVILTTVTGSTAALNQIDTLGGPAAIASGAGVYQVIEDVGGRILVPPGVAIGLMQVGASTALVQSAITWEELDAATYLQV